MHNLSNLEIGMQSQDSENVQHNLEIAQIPRLHGTYTWQYQVEIEFILLRFLTAISCLKRCSTELPLRAEPLYGT